MSCLPEELWDGVTQPWPDAMFFISKLVEKWNTVPWDLLR